MSWGFLDVLKEIPDRVCYSRIIVISRLNDTPMLIGLGLPHIEDSLLIIARLLEAILLLGEEIVMKLSTKQWLYHLCVIIILLSTSTNVFVSKGIYEVLL